VAEVESPIEAAAAVMIFRNFRRPIFASRALGIFVGTSKIGSIGWPPRRGSLLLKTPDFQWEIPDFKTNNIGNCNPPYHFGGYAEKGFDNFPSK